MTYLEMDVSGSSDETAVMSVFVTDREVGKALAELLHRDDP